MNYYTGTPIKRYNHTYNTFTPFGDKKVSEVNEVVFITKETDKQELGYSWRGRFQYNKATGEWKHYKDNKWRPQNGSFTQLQA